MKENSSMFRKRASLLGSGFACVNFFCQWPNSQYPNFRKISGGLFLVMNVDEDEEVAVSHELLNARNDPVRVGLVLFCLMCLFVLGLKGFSLLRVCASLLLSAVFARFLHVRLNLLLSTRNTNQLLFRPRLLLRHETLHQRLAVLLAWTRDAAVWKAPWHHSALLVCGLGMAAILLQWVNALIVLSLLGTFVVIKSNVAS